MGLDSISVTANLKITKENCEKLLDKHYDDSFTIADVFESIGWDTTYSRKNGITAVSRDFGGWIEKHEYELFKSLAPYVEPGSYIEFEFLYDGASYEKWVFEDRKLVVYDGKIDITWTENKNPDYR